MSKTRSLIEILRHPKTDADERLADEHIRAMCLEIQATWSERERASRERYRSGEWMPMVLEWIGTVEK